MDNAYNGEYKALLNELIQGMECAKQLRVHLNSAASSETQYFFLQRILSSYEKALLILKWRLVGQSHPVAPPLPGAPEPSISLNGSLDVNNNSFKEQQDYNVSKKRYALFDLSRYMIKILDVVLILMQFLTCFFFVGLQKGDANMDRTSKSWR
nr:probable WRKY transcription factor 53 [Ipomoea trifida]